MATCAHTAHRARYQASGEIPLLEVADPGLIGRAVGLNFVVLPRPIVRTLFKVATAGLICGSPALSSVETPCGRVPLRPDGLTRHGFLPADAWKDLTVEQARRAMLERTMERLVGTLAP